jgi:hypothetical protein
VDVPDFQMVEQNRVRASDEDCDQHCTLLKSKGHNTRLISMNKA